jgi:hypothetical protein
MNYSTAKTILFLYRRQEKLRELLKPEPDTPTDFPDEDLENSPRAGFRAGTQRLQVCSTINGSPEETTSSHCSLGRVARQQQPHW